MLEPERVTVGCDHCDRRVLLISFNDRLGELVRGMEAEGWTFTEHVDTCPNCSRSADLVTPMPPDRTRVIK